MFQGVTVRIEVKAARQLEVHILMSVSPELEPELVVQGCSKLQGLMRLLFSRRRGGTENRAPSNVA